MMNLQVAPDCRAGHRKTTKGKAMRSSSNKAYYKAQS